MRLFNIFKKNTENLEKINNTMEKFRGEVFELDLDEFSNGIIKLSRSV